MVTSEPNKFAVDAKMPSYKEIKQRARRARQTFIKRAMKNASPDVIVNVSGFDS